MSISDFHINIEDGLIGDNSFSSVVYPHKDGVEYDYDEDLTVDLEIKILSILKKGDFWVYKKGSKVV